MIFIFIPISNSVGVYMYVWTTDVKKNDIRENKIKKTSKKQK